MSLFQLMLQQHTWAHVSTGVGTLDELMRVPGPLAVVDFQDVAGLAAASAAVRAMGRAHGARGPVVTVRCGLLGPTRDPRSGPPGLEGSVTSFGPKESVTNKSGPFGPPQSAPPSTQNGSSRTGATLFYCRSLSQLYVLLLSLHKSLAKNTLLVLEGIHDLVDQYRLSLWRIQKHTLLKAQMEVNDALLHGHTPAHIPPASDLLCVHPGKKGQGHIDKVVDLISRLAVDHHSLVVLQGRLDVRHVDGARRFVPTLTEYDALLLSRVLFYRDWHQGRLVYWAKVENMHQVGINEPVPFEIVGGHPVDLSPEPDTSMNLSIDTSRTSVSYLPLSPVASQGSVVEASDDEQLLSMGPEVLT